MYKFAGGAVAAQHSIGLLLAGMAAACVVKIQSGAIRAPIRLGISSIRKPFVLLQARAAFGISDWRFCPGDRRLAPRAIRRRDSCHATIIFPIDPLQAIVIFSINKAHTGFNANP
jgi:hypothetical protein